MDLTGKQKRHLRALAHPLGPSLIVGNDGVTPGVVKAVREALRAHELIKVKFGEGVPVKPKAGAGAALASEVGAGLVQVIGGVVVLYKRHPQEPQIKLPAAKRK